METSYNFPNTPDVGVIDVFGPMRVNSQSKVPDIENWGYTNEAALQVQGAAVITGASVNLGFFKHSGNVTRVWDQYGLVGDFGGTINRYFDPTAHDATPMVISGGLPVYRFAGIRVDFTAPNVVSGHLSTVEIASAPLYDDTRLHPNGVWALNVSGGKARFGGGQESTSATNASVVMMGGVSIAGTALATSYSQGGALSIAGGLGIGGNAMIGSDMTIGGGIKTMGDVALEENAGVRWGTSGHYIRMGGTSGLGVYASGAQVMDVMRSSSSSTMMLMNGTRMFMAKMDGSATGIVSNQSLTLTTGVNPQQIWDATDGITLNDNVRVTKRLSLDSTSSSALAVVGNLISSGGGQFLGSMSVQTEMILGTTISFRPVGTEGKLFVEGLECVPKVSIAKRHNSLYDTTMPELGIYSLGNPDTAHGEGMSMKMNGTDFCMDTISWGQGNQRALKLSASGTYSNMVLCTDGSSVIGQNINIGNQGVITTNRPININDVTKVSDYGSTFGGALNVMGDILVRNRMFFNAMNNSLFSGPKTGSRSRGTRIVLDPKLSPANVDSAIGCDNTSQWYSLPNASYSFDWYNGTVRGLSLMNGNLTVAKTLGIGQTNKLTLQVNSSMNSYALTFPSSLPSNTIKSYLSCDSDGKLDWDNSILNDGNLLVNGVVLSNALAYQTTLQPSSLMDTNYELTLPATLPPNTDQMYLAAEMDGRMKWVTAIGQNSPQITTVMDYDSGAISLGSDFNFATRMYVSFYIIILPQYLEFDGTLTNYPIRINVEIIRQKFPSTRTYQQANWTITKTSNQDYQSFIDFSMVGNQLHYTTRPFTNLAFIPYNPPTSFNVVHCSPIVVN